MKKKIQLYNKTIEYFLKRSNRAKRMRLAVYCDGSFVVTIPKKLNHDKAKKYIIQKSKWITTKLDFFNKLNSKNVTNKSPKDFEKYKKQALDLVLKRIDYYNKIYQFSFNKVSIKKQKTCWGSCSKKKNLNFNYKIALLPKEVIDYIVVHELCHLKEFNHSNKFWKLVGKALPNYSEIKKYIINNGLNLI